MHGKILITPIMCNRSADGFLPRRAFRFRMASLQSRRFASRRRSVSSGDAICRSASSPQFPAPKVQAKAVILHLDTFYFLIPPERKPDAAATRCKRLVPGPEPAEFMRVSYCRSRAFWRLLEPSPLVAGRCIVAPDILDSAEFFFACESGFVAV